MGLLHEHEREQLIETIISYFPSGLEGRQALAAWTIEDLRKLVLGLRNGGLRRSVNLRKEARQ